MAMPIDLVFVRHGQSEANIVQKSDDHGLDETIAHEIFSRPDWRNRLTSLGVEQARTSGRWIEKEIGALDSFDALYVSPFLRTRETAAYLGGTELKGWTIDDRLVERSWGVYGSVPRAEQRAQFPRTAEAKRTNPWYIRLDGGESMPDVYGRFRDFQGTLHREQAGKRVLVVSHGDFINVSRYGLERMLPEQWEDTDVDPEYVLRNGMVLHYTRVNPNDPTDIRDKMRWRRYANPSDPAKTPDAGQWVELPERQRFSGQELLDQVEIAPRLLTDEHDI